MHVQKENFHGYTFISQVTKPIFNPLSAYFIKWSNALKQFVGKLQRNCLSVFDHFVRLAVKGLRVFRSILNINFSWVTSSHHMRLKIPQFLVIFQLLWQIFSCFCFCFVFPFDKWSKYFDWFKKQSLHDISNLDKSNWYFSPSIDRL